MINVALGLWHNLPLFIKLPLDFCFSVVFVRGILAKEIMDYLKEKGLFKEGLIHATLHALEKYVPSTERKLAIWTHYKLQHATESVLDCNDGQCSVL